MTAPTFLRDRIRQCLATQTELGLLSGCTRSFINAITYHKYRLTLQVASSIAPRLHMDPIDLYFMHFGIEDCQSSLDRKRAEAIAGLLSDIAKMEDISDKERCSLFLDVTARVQAVLGIE